MKSKKIIIFCLIIVSINLHLSGRNKVAILDNPTISLQARIDLIRKATKSIDMATYIYGNDETSSQTLHEIVKAAERGVKVRIIIDALNNHIPKELTAFMLNKGIRIKVFNKFALKKGLDNVIRMHAKIMVSDRLRYIIGGRNIVNTYFYIGNDVNFRDREIYISGISGKQASLRFEDLWFSALLDEIIHDKTLSEKKNLKIVKEYFDDLGTMTFLEDRNVISSLKKLRYFEIPELEIVIDRPHSYKFTEKNTTQFLIHRINLAETCILIESPYVIFSEEIYNALANAISRGVKVQIITNSMMTSDSYLVLPVYFKERDYLIKNGFEILEFQGKNQYLHTKMFILDNQEVIIGSFNLDMLSANINTEIFVSIIDSSLVDESIKYFNTTKRESVTAEISPFKPVIFEGTINLKSLKKYSIIKLLEYTIAPYLRDYL